MNYRLVVCMIYALLLVQPCESLAEKLTLFVKPVTVIGNNVAEDTNKVLQSLIVARLADDNLLPVASEGEADIMLLGTFIVMGDQYSFDMLVLDKQARALNRKAIVGSEKLPSFFKLSERMAIELKPELHKIVTNTNVKNPKITNAENNIIRKSSELTREDRYIQRNSNALISTNPVLKMSGSFSLLRNSTLGNTIYLCDNRSIKVLRSDTGDVLSLASLEVGSKIINIDAMNHSNTTDYLFVTYIHMNTVYTNIYSAGNVGLKLVSEKVPFYTRVVRLKGSHTKLLVQEQGVDADRYYGSVFEASWDGIKLSKIKEKVLPRYGHIYNFNEFTDKQGAVFTALYDDNSYLTVYDSSFKRVWSSNDKFGGSELSFDFRDIANITKTGKEYKTFFMNQRIDVLPNQEVLVGYNDGTLVIGDSRSYKKGAVYNFTWNGSALEEVWRTKESQSYMPDFEYDPKTKTLYQLQLVQREDPFKGDAAMSSIIIKKVE